MEEGSTNQGAQVPTELERARKSPGGTSPANTLTLASETDFNFSSPELSENFVLNWEICDKLSQQP
jgi:hypothetical protein